MTAMLPSSLARSGGWRPTAADTMFTPCLPKVVPTRPIIPGTSE